MKMKIFLAIFLCLFLLTPATANEIVQLVDDTGSYGFPQWSPDGEKLVYVSSNNLHQVELWTMDADGSNKKQIASGMIGFGLNNPWSPDGTKIFYSSVDYWFFDSFWIYNIHTSEKRKISGINNIKYVEWVFNGSKLFIVEEEGNTQNLWLVDSDGTKKTLLFSLSGKNTGFLWQPNGNRILYASNESGNYDLWVMNSDGSGKKQLTSTPENENGMDLSPNGDKILYGSINVFDKSNPSTFKGFSNAICAMDINGANKKQLTVANGNWDHYSKWSPDGTKIAFERRDDTGNRADIIVMNADGSNLTILTANDISGAFPQWSPKGNKIAFVSSKDGKIGISVIMLDEELASAPATNVAYKPDTAKENTEKTSGFGVSITVFTLFLLCKNMKKRN